MRREDALAPVCLDIFYVILGCVLESIAMMLISVPVFFPLVLQLSYDPFGFREMVVVKIGLVTSPVELNIFVIRARLPEIPLLPSFGASSRSSLRDPFLLRCC
jgi:TRAP-type C4-dicarboxylate transport system permease large subunit